MSTVYYDSPVNSTHFTTCCRVAITTRQRVCPRCNTDVWPYCSSMTDAEAAKYYRAPHRVDMARSIEARRSRR